VKFGQPTVNEIARAVSKNCGHEEGLFERTSRNHPEAFKTRPRFLLNRPKTAVDLPQKSAKNAEILNRVTVLMGNFRSPGR
jgi:hypothetical protein